MNPEVGPVLVVTGPAPQTPGAFYSHVKQMRPYGVHSVHGIFEGKKLYNQYSWLVATGRLGTAFRFKKVRADHRGTGKSKRYPYELRKRKSLQVKLRGVLTKL